MGNGYCMILNLIKIPIFFGYYQYFYSFIITHNIYSAPFSSNLGFTKKCFEKYLSTNCLINCT